MYLLCRVTAGRHVLALEAESLDGLMPLVEQGGTWSVWERPDGQPETKPVGLTCFTAPTPVTVYGGARCLEDRWRRSQPRAGATLGGLTLAKLEELVAAGRARLAGGTAAASAAS